MSDSRFMEEDQIVHLVISERILGRSRGFYQTPQENWTCVDFNQLSLLEKDLRKLPARAPRWKRVSPASENLDLIFAIEGPQNTPYEGNSSINKSQRPSLPA
jgi:hypothetical protein